MMFGSSGPGPNFGFTTLDAPELHPLLSKLNYELED